MEKLTRILADYTLAFDLGKKAPEVTEKAKMALKDCLGCLLAGANEEPVRILRRYADGIGARGMSTVLGVKGLRLDAGNAAMINGTAAHFHDYDDVSTNVTGHPSVVIFPAALAVGEEIGASGRAVLEAYALGVEVMGLMGRGLNPQHYSRGWHNTATLGVFGAAAAAGKLLGLNREQLSHTFSIAASRSAGLKGNFGTMTKSLHAGLAASNGIFSAKVAGLGMDANPDIFEMDEGYVSVTTGEMDLKAITEFITLEDSEFLNPGIAIKPFPSCKATHNGINAAMELQSTYGFQVEEIEKVFVECQPIAKDLLKYPEAVTPLQGKFSMNYCVACGLVRGKVGLGDFEGAEITDREILSLMKKIRMEVSEEISQGQYYNGTWETAVNITLRDGRHLRKQVRYATGDPENPLSVEQINEKFLDCIGRTVDFENAGQMMDDIDHLENLPCIADLITHMERCLR